MTCGDGSCAADLACCETFDLFDAEVLEGWKCSAAPNAGGNCCFTDAISLCDEAADCSDYPSGPIDPAVCCFTRGGLQQGRECTTASACAAGAASAYGFTILPGFMGMESTTKCVATKAFYRSPRSTH